MQVLTGCNLRSWWSFSSAIEHIYFLAHHGANGACTGTVTCTVGININKSTVIGTICKQTPMNVEKDHNMDSITT